MTKLLTDEELKKQVEVITQTMFVALSEWQAGVAIDWQSAKIKGRAELVKLIQSQKLVQQPKWWVTTGLKLNGKKLLGPFESKDLALDVRKYMEMAETPATYWVEEVSNV